jgi:hypothetical protein
MGLAPVMLRKFVLLVGLAAVLGIGYWWFIARETPPDPVMVLITQMRTRAVIEHERRVTVWYKSCPEVPGINPEVFVIWPGRLLYTLDLAKSQLTLKGEVLQVSTPPIEVEEPAVPSDLAQFAANNPFWNLSTDASIGNAAIRKATPVARYLSIYFLKHDPTLRGYFSKELEVYLRGVAGALNVPVREVAVDIAEAKVPTPVLPALELCSGTTASANGVPFLREQDGDTIYVFPRAQQ